MKYLSYIFVIFLLSGCDQLLEDLQNSTYSSHNQGQSCLNCHNEFSSGGTIYKYLDATSSESTTIANNHTVKLILADGTIVTMLIGNGNGNFRTKAIINQTFTASIIDETGATIRTSGTHQSSSLNCNSCHTSSGSNSAPGRISTTNSTISSTTTVTTTDPSSIRYKSHNQGVNCLNCHNGSNEDNFTLAGTIYTSVNATTANSSTVATNYTARVTLADGTQLIMGVARGNGNIYYDGAVGQTFTVEILDINGDVVNSSSTHALTSTSCNTCHTSSGTNGAPGRIYTTQPLVVSSTSSSSSSDDDEDDDDD